MIKDMLDSDPVTSITGLVGALSMNPASYFFISPDDYYNNSIVSEAERSEIEKEIASIANDRINS